MHGSLCGKVFRTGKRHHFDSLEEVRNNPESFGNAVGRLFYEPVVAEELKSGCDVPLIGRSGVVGVLTALKRSERAFGEQELEFLEQVSGPVAIAVENALDYERSRRQGDH